MSKPRMARKNVRSEKIQIRFTPAELARLKATVLRDGELYVSDWMRAIVMQVVDTGRTEA